MTTQSIQPAQYTESAAGGEYTDLLITPNGGRLTPPSEAQQRGSNPAAAIDLTLLIVQCFVDR